MNGLTNQQLVLVALLVSFVTSLATGIFTVSLMSQAPQGVVQTINNVVEHIVAQDNASANGAAAATPLEEKIPSAIARVSRSIVRLAGANSETIAGIGLTVSSKGIVITDKSVIASLGSFQAILADGTHIPMVVIQSQINGDIVFLAPAAGDTGIVFQKIASTTFTPIVFAPTPKLGGSVLSLSGAQPPLLGQGLISRIADASSGTPRVDTTILASQVSIGSPLFTLDGEVIGISAASIKNDAGTAGFYPVGQLKVVIPYPQSR